VPVITSPQNALRTRCIFTSCQCFPAPCPLKTIGNNNKLRFRPPILKNLSSRHQTQGKKIQGSFNIVLSVSTPLQLVVSGLQPRRKTSWKSIVYVRCRNCSDIATQRELFCKNSERKRSEKHVHTEWKNKEWHKMRMESLFPYRSPWKRRLITGKQSGFTSSTGTKYKVKRTNARVLWLNTQEGCTQTPFLPGFIVCSTV